MREKKEREGEKEKLKSRKNLPNLREPEVLNFACSMVGVQLGEKRVKSPGARGKKEEKVQGDAAFYWQSARARLYAVAARHTGARRARPVERAPRDFNGN